MNPKILVAWIGHVDLWAMAQEGPARIRQRVTQVTSKNAPQDAGLGPIRFLAEKIDFEHIHLLSNNPASINRQFKKWLNQPAEIHSVTLAEPTDYNKIFQICDAFLARLEKEINFSRYRLCIHLSPGTPAMAAIWVLLGKSRYPATFYQTTRDQFWETEIPFDLLLDYVPDVLQKPDKYLQHLASRSPQEVQGFEGIIGDSKVLRVAVGRAQRAAVRDINVLLLGESGTGKEMFARAIHTASRRNRGPFVPINCAAIPKELLESELFGHKAGSFTGASATRRGAFREADGGTLFLDEIAECEPSVQAKLLRALQPPPEAGSCIREYQPLGSDKLQRSDVRIIAATNRNLLMETKQGRFRDDLYYRLAIITIRLPALRERATDIPRLADSFIHQINHEFAQQEPGYRHKNISVQTKIFIKQLSWPGNIRELYNALVQAAVFTDTDTIGINDIKSVLSDFEVQDEMNVFSRSLGNGFSINALLDDIRRHYMVRALQEAEGVKTKAARLLGLKNYQALDAQLKRLKIMK